MEPPAPDSSNEHNVTSLHGDPVVQPTKNETWIAICRKALEQAEAGVTTGGYVVQLHSDHGASYSMGGFIGTASLLGQGMMAQKKLMEQMEAEYES